MTGKGLKSDFPILIVEDSPVSRKILEKNLLKAGYEVASAENGLEALERLQSRFFPIVLSDWIMPEMDGLNLCRAIRKGEFQGYIFIVLLTAKDSKSDIIAGLEAGADDYLTKPFHSAELMARIQTGIRILNLEKSLKKANEEIQRLSKIDPLTGCFNRSYLNERLPNEILRARRYRHPLSLILSDIDHFKKINDAHGHLIGDKVLKDYANGLTAGVRINIDWVVRYGGEEFIIILPETTFDDAVRVAERIRMKIEKMKIKINGDSLFITSSFGVTGFDTAVSDELISPEMMIKRADQYLYQAKQTGRNRVNGGLME
ncbi:MAG: diguanylate cyclase response regulator [Deltaproteobacteria bacterium RBG_13_49_15]|nr:MAG: diguanylate cyclase response regulator [Deltaproteobacteria bacterium RBG_13_49_15]